MEQIRFKVFRLSICLSCICSLLLFLLTSLISVAETPFRKEKGVLAGSNNYKSQFLPTGNKYYVDPDYIRSRGVSFVTDFGFLHGIGSYTYNLVNLPEVKKNNTFLGLYAHGELSWIIHRKLSMGIGSGAEAFQSYAVTPLYGVMRIAFSERQTSPFLNISGGTVFGVKNEHSGPFINLAVGMKTYINYHNYLTFSAGYRYQELFYAKYTDISGLNYDYNDYISLHFLTLSMGLAF